MACRINIISSKEHPASSIHLDAALEVSSFVRPRTLDMDGASLDVNVALVCCVCAVDSVCTEIDIPAGSTLAQLSVRGRIDYI
jgi:hypothetical protein